MTPLISAQGDKETAVADDHLIRPFISETTVVVMKVEPARIFPSPKDGSEDEKSAKQQWSSSPLISLLKEDEGTGALLEKLRDVLHEIRTVTEDLPIFATVQIPKSKQETPLRLLVKRGSDEATQRLTAWIEDFGRWKVDVRDDLVVASGAHPSDDSIAGPALTDDLRPSLVEAFAVVSEYPIQALFVPPEYLWRTVRELLTDLPPQLDGGPSSILTEGVQWAALGVNPSQLRLHLTIQSRSDEDAQKLAATLPDLLRSCYRLTPEIREVIPMEVFASMMAAVEPAALGDRVVVTVDVMDVGAKQLESLLKLARVAEAGMRRHEDLRLRQILIAMHNYHDSFGEFPPANRYRDSDGKLGLSWRVHLLPYLDEADLYREFRLDEPWDSEHNQKLLTRMPDLFSHSSRILDTHDRPAPGYTTLVAPAGEDAVFGGETSHSFAQIVDGTTNTVVLVEVVPDRAVPWTAPRDFDFDPDNPMDGILILPDNRWLAGTADGSLQWLRADISPQTVLHLFQKSDGQPIPSNERR